MSIQPLADEATKLHHELMEISPSEVTKIEQLIWKLKSNIQKHPSDLNVRLVLLEANQKLGKVGEAIRLSDLIWPKRMTLGVPQLQTYLNVLSRLGVYERVIELSRETRARFNLSGTFGAQQVINAGWGIGDFGIIEEGTRHWPEQNLFWSRARQQLEDYNLLARLSEHQRIVHHSVFGKQSDAFLMPLDSETGVLELTYSIYMSASRSERLAIEDKIHSELDNLYKDTDQAESYRRILPIIILGSEATPELKVRVDYQVAR